MMPNTINKTPNGKNDDDPAFVLVPPRGLMLQQRGTSLIAMRRGAPPELVVDYAVAFPTNITTYGDQRSSDTLSSIPPMLLRGKSTAVVTPPVGRTTALVGAKEESIGHHSASDLTVSDDETFECWATGKPKFDTPASSRKVVRSAARSPKTRAQIKEAASSSEAQATPAGVLFDFLDSDWGVDM